MRYLRTLSVWLCLASQVIYGDQPSPEQIQKYIAGLESPDEEVRGENILQLQQRGPEARAATAALIKRLKDKGGFVDRLDRYYPDRGFVARDIRSAAISALKSIGLEAVPELEAALADDDRLFRLAVLQILQELGPKAVTAADRVIPLLKSPDKVIRRIALDVICGLDQNGKIAMPIIRQLVATGDDRAAAWLGRYPNHPDTLALLESALKSADPAVRGEAAYVLGNLPGPSRKIVELLLPLINDEGTRTVAISNHASTERQVRDEALDGLLNHHAPADKLLPEYWKMLDEKGFDFAVRSELVFQDILRLIPTPPGTGERVFKYYRDAVAFRQKAMKEDEDWYVSAELGAVICLARLPEQSRRLLPQLQELFQSQDEYVRAEAAALLVALDPASNAKALAHVVYVIELLSSPADPKDQETAKELQAERNRRFGDDIEYLRQVLISAICANDKLAEQMLPKLIEWYRDPGCDWFVRREVLEPCFMRLGPKAKAAAGDLIDNFHSFDAPDVIVALGPDVVPLLMEKAEGPAEPWTQLKYLALLAKFDKHARPALPIFWKVLESGHPLQRVAVIKYLGQLPSLSAEVTPELIKRLKDDRCEIRSAAVTSLGAFAESKDVIIPALIAAMQDDYAEVRAVAVESLVKLGLDQAPVRTALQSATEDRHPCVRMLANEALQKK